MVIRIDLYLCVGCSSKLFGFDDAVGTVPVNCLLMPGFLESSTLAHEWLVSRTTVIIASWLHTNGVLLACILFPTVLLQLCASNVCRIGSAMSLLLDFEYYCVNELFWCHWNVRVLFSVRVRFHANQVKNFLGQRHIFTYSKSMVNLWFIIISRTYMPWETWSQIISHARILAFCVINELG